MKFSLILASHLLFAHVAFADEMPAAASTTNAPAAEQDAAASSSGRTEAGNMESVCTMAGNTRRVKLDMSQEKCQVLYYKETEKPGVEARLWEYSHEFDKCKESYSGFVTKLRGMSWSCS